jgi:hypothetical protein
METYVGNPLKSFPIFGALAAEIKLSIERVGARTDGDLQICFPRDGNLIAWDRSYYEIAPTKRFYQTKCNKDGTEETIEIDDPDDSIHVCQVFTEMLGATCHPEFFEHADLKVTHPSQAPP